MYLSRGGVAFFDSGIGGLTVLDACRKRLGAGVYYYYGDNGRAPYGNLPPKKIRRYVFRAFRRFNRMGVSAAVLACNTATAVCIDKLRRRFSFPIVGTEPAVRIAAKKGGRVLVLATRATCDSERLHRLCERVKSENPTVEILVRPCEGLAGEIERRLGVEEYDFTHHLPKEQADAVVLGCTHYIYIVKQIEAFYGCPVYDGNEGIARRLETVLQESDGFSCRGDRHGTDGERQPFFKKNVHKMGALTTKAEKMGMCQSLSNKRLGKNAKKCGKTLENGEVVFIGKCKEINEKAYKQMFV